MGKSRPGYKRKQRGIVVQQDRFWLVKLIEIIITLLLWCYLLGTITLTASIAFGWDFEWKRLVLLILHTNERDVQLVLYKIGIISIILFVLQFIWSKYNQLAFGKLKRRKFPQDVTAKELAEYFSLTEEEIEYLQNNDIIKLKDRFV
jgi:poly-beta-1,6-N-acetyl-D-glucosamine biosynthesis protein PgaD